MEFTMLRMLALLSLPALFLTLSIAHAEAKEVKATKQWAGSVENDELAKEAPAFIADAKELEKLWKSWKIEEKVPKVDFDKVLVVVMTTGGSRINFGAKLDEKGNLSLVGMATLDLVPGFRYIIATVSREGVKSVNGKEVKK
jgi:hypothetical protein